MTTTAIRKKLVEYLQTADDKKVRVIYTMAADEIETEAHDFDDETFEELKRRTKSFLDGSAKMYAWEETQKAAMGTTPKSRPSFRSAAKKSQN